MRYYLRISPFRILLAALLRLADAAYRLGMPVVPDAVFDRLLAAAPGALRPIRGPLLSLDCPAAPFEWLEASQGPFCVQLKADGVSINLVYRDGVFVHAHLRGGRDVTEAALRAGIITELPGDPEGLVEVRGEVIAPGLSRNACAAALRRGDGKVKLQVLAFDLVGMRGVGTVTAAVQWLKCAGFAVLDCMAAQDAADVDSMFKDFCALQHAMPFDCDGIVVKVDSKMQQARMGHTSRAPRWAIALKP